MNTKEKIQHIKNWMDYYYRQFEKTKNRKYLVKYFELDGELGSLQSGGINKLIVSTVTTTEHLKKFNEALRKVAPNLLKDYSTKLLEHAKHLKPIGTKFKAMGADISIVSSPYLKGDDIYMMSNPDGLPVILKGENKDEPKKDFRKS